jgi:hypothetical protein
MYWRIMPACRSGEFAIAAEALTNYAREVLIADDQRTVDKEGH